LLIGPQKWYNYVVVIIVFDEYKTFR